MSEARKRSAEKILEVNLAIGELTFLNPEQLRFAFEVLSEGTPAEKAKLNIETVSTRVNCPQCGYRGPILYEGPENHFGYATAFLMCKVCGCRDLEIVSGRECTIKNLKVVASSRDAACKEGA